MIEFRVQFKGFLKTTEKEIREELQANILFFEKCRTRIKQEKNGQKELIWGACYSYSNKISKEFL